MSVDDGYGRFTSAGERGDDCDECGREAKDGDTIFVSPRPGPKDHCLCEDCYCAAGERGEDSHQQQLEDAYEGR